MLIVMILAGSIAAAADQAADAPPMDFSCAAPLSHVSQLRVHRSGNAHRVSGSLAPVRLEPVPDNSKPILFDGHDMPSIFRGAWVEINDDDSGATVAIHLTPRNRQPGGGTIVSDVVVKTWIDGEQRSYALIVNTSRDYRDVVPFEIVAVDDRVRVEAGGKQVELIVPLGPRTVVELACVGGQFDIEGVRIGGAGTRP